MTLDHRWLREERVARMKIHNRLAKTQRERTDADRPHRSPQRLQARQEDGKARQGQEQAAGIGAYSRETQT